MKKQKITISVLDRKGNTPCHRGHIVGQSFDFDTQRGQICPMAMHIAFIYIDILRYGGKFEGENPNEICFSCPDYKTLNIFKITLSE